MFTLKIEHVLRVSPAPSEVWVMDGYLESGKVQVGSVGVVEVGGRSRPIKITGVAIKSFPASPGLMSFTIEKPDFPTEGLEGKLLVGE